METDEMELDTIGDRKTALFVIISDTDDTFNFVVSILYTQLFNLLCDKADDEYGGRLPVHVRCLLDEFANIGQIPKFEKLIATIRSREISASIILQSQSQLKAIYKDNADTIVGNCDTTLFLGGKEKTTLKEISEILGKETIDSFNTSETRGRELSHGLNYQKLGKDKPPVIQIKSKDMGDYVTLSITDNGIGIKPSEVNRVFDKGFVGSNGRMRKKSTGIGLYLCDQLCLKLGIGIDIESEVGCYTTVLLHFPKSNHLNV